MRRFRVFIRGLSLPSLAALLAPAAFFAGPLHAQGPRDRFPPSYYGYNLDDPHPGYFGGGRYNEYYKFGRGWAFANYPDSLPWFPPYRPWIEWKAAPPPDAFAQIVIPQAETVCHIGLRVPDGAEVFVDGVKSKQTGTLREFVSPPLTPGQTYIYTLRARWKENGKPVEQSQEVGVTSGSRTELVFPVPPAREPLPAPKPLPQELLPADPR